MQGMVATEGMAKMAKGVATPPLQRVSEAWAAMAPAVVVAAVEPEVFPSALATLVRCPRSLLSM